MDREPSPDIHKPSKPELRERDTFVYQPILDSDDSFSFARPDAFVMPALPSVRLLNEFILLAKEVVKLPEKKSALAAHDSGTLNLDDMLAEPQILDNKRFVELVSLGLELIQGIDARFFDSPPRAKTPYQELSQQADIAKDLVAAVKGVTAVIKKCYALESEEILKRVLRAIDYHRGDSLSRKVEALEVSGRLAMLEICYDGGVAPVIPKPTPKAYENAQTDSSSTSESKSLVGGAKKPAPERKQINYGRPEASQKTNDESAIEADILARRGEPTNKEMREMRDREAQADERMFLHQNEREEVN